MNLLCVLLVVLIVLAVLGGGFIGDGAYRGPGFGIGGILLIVLIVLILRGGL